MNKTRFGLWAGRRTLLTLALVFAMSGVLLPVAAQAASRSGQHGQHGQVYYVRPGDTLAGIAAWFGTSMESLMRANSIYNPNYIWVGQPLDIPDGSDGTGGLQNGGFSCADYYYIGYRDTLSGIALQYGIDTYDLARANGIYDLNEIYQGQHLCIPGKGRNDNGYGKSGKGYAPSLSSSAPYSNGSMNQQEPPAQYQPQSGQPQQPDHSMDGKSHANGPMNQQDPSMQYQQSGQPQQPDHSMDGKSHSNGPMNQQEPPAQYQPQSGQPQQPDHSMDGKSHSNGPMQNMPDSGPTMQGQQPGQPMTGPNQGGAWPGPDHNMNQPPMDFWKGTYYKDKYFSEFVEEKQDPEIRFNWYKGSPDDKMPKDRFSIRWERTVFFKTGHYRFTATADDGVRVYVDDQLIIDAWKIQPATTYHADMFLQDGTHRIVVEYYEESEDAQIQFNWEQLRW